MDTVPSCALRAEKIISVISIDPPEIGEAIATQISAAISGMISVEKALKNANDAVYEIMDDAGYY